MGIRPYAEADRDLTVALETDPQVMAHLGGVSTVEAADRVHRWRMEAPARGDFFVTIVPDGTDEAVGVLGVWRSEIEGESVYELGAMLRPGHQARGVAAEAWALLRRQVAAAGVTRVESYPGTANAASNAVLRKIGFTRVGEVDLDYEGRPLRCAHWTLEL
jgi:RimJ/RimL family protein N-acetyltransferase